MTLDPQFDAQLQVFHGAASDAVCRVYAQLGGALAEAGGRLTGTLTGPHCRYAKTLPATSRLLDRGPGQTLLAEAIVPEPCFWTPEMPHLYTAAIELRRGDELLAQTQRTLGIRPLGVERRKLILHGKRFVLRGVRTETVGGTCGDELHESFTSSVAREPTEAWCAEASDRGVLVLADFDGHDLSTIVHLSRWPAVGIAALPAGTKLPGDFNVRNLLLAERFTAGQELHLAPWAHLAIVPADEARALAERTRNCAVPILVERPAQRPSSVATARLACEHLQADLAGHGDYAGFIV